MSVDFFAGASLGKRAITRSCNSPRTQPAGTVSVVCAQPARSLNHEKNWTRTIMMNLKQSDKDPRIAQPAAVVTRVLPHADFELETNPAGKRSAAAIARVNPHLEPANAQMLSR